jgi:protein-arginine kinase activator protein McsA
MVRTVSLFSPTCSFIRMNKRDICTLYTYCVSRIVCIILSQLCKLHHYFESLTWLTVTEYLCYKCLTTNMTYHYFESLTWLTVTEYLCYKCLTTNMTYHYFESLTWLTVTEYLCYKCLTTNMTYHYFESLTWLTVTEYLCYKCLTTDMTRLSQSQFSPFSIHDLFTEVCNKNNTTGTSSGARTSYPSGASEFTPVVCGVCVANL